MRPGIIFSILAATIFFVIGVLDSPAHACGPFFPNRVLMGGDNAVLRAPQPTFAVEIERIIDESGGLENFPLIPPQDMYSPWDQTSDIGQSDIEAALTDEGRSQDEIDSILAEYNALRINLSQYAERMNDLDLFLYPTSNPMLQWRDYLANPPSNRYALPWIDASQIPSGSRPEIAKIPQDLPDEFRLYLEGAVQYYLGNWDEARYNWETLLDLPADQRHYRSTWAAFMIGKVLMYSNPENSTAAFQMVRDLARDGYSDNLGLAHATWLWEARAELVRKNYTFVINRYMDIYADGDQAIVIPLLSTIRDIFVNEPGALVDVASDPLSRKIVSIYLATHTSPGFEDWAPSISPDHASLWLDALETVGVIDPETIDLLAWGSYEAGRIDLAERWLDRAGADNGLTLWLRAKLAIRSGDFEIAKNYLERAADAFPPDETWVGSEVGWVLYIPGLGDTTTIPHAQVLMELGAIQLRMNNFNDALDSLLRSGSWWDAAYIAERLLSPDELKNYVDTNWPNPVAVDDYVPWSYMVENPDEFETRIGGGIRYLLGRRLVRIGRWREGRAYLPENLQGYLDTYITAIRTAGDTSLSDEDRAEAYWEAATTARHQGMEIMGCELEPDFSVVGGNYYPFEITEYRAATDFASYANPDNYVYRRVHELFGDEGFRLLFPATSEERRRLTAYTAEIEPYHRFHYRYIAQDHAWNAIALMPDESDETARRICIAGNWLTRFDSSTVTRFYRALINRCGTTELGLEAVRTGRLPEIEVY